MRVQPRAVIFDMDGVLVDSYQPHWLSWSQTCAERGVSITPEQFAELFGSSFGAFVEALSHRPFSVDELQRWDEEKEARYRAIIEADFPAMPGATALLRELHAEGFRLGVASAGPRANVDCLRRCLPGAELLAATISANDTRRTKPDPEPFLACASLLGVPPEDCVVVEDSVHGLIGAHAAGMHSVGLVGTATEAELRRHADLVVQSLCDLNARRFRHWTRAPRAV